MSVTEYFTQIKKLWDAYNNMIKLPYCATSGDSCVSLIAAKKMIHDQQLMQFLVGLHEDYRNVRGNILMIKHCQVLTKSIRLCYKKRNKEPCPLLSLLATILLLFIAMYLGIISRIVNFNKGLIVKGYQNSILH